MPVVFPHALDSHVELSLEPFLLTAPPQILNEERSFGNDLMRKNNRHDAVTSIVWPGSIREGLRC